ncbi:MAG: DUF2058 domain-containing protein [Gammaproteobacteria bacterium]|nr:DUF2058 domain-containing protein [Gammaproteobacteria bacterium]
MASLQDQLLKAGLVDKNTAKKVSKEKQKANKAARKSGGKLSAANSSEVNAIKAQNAERDRELNRKKQEAAEAKAIAAQIRQLIELNKADRSAGEIGYNFVYEKKVKTIYVTEDIQTQIALGRLIIVSTESTNQSPFELVPKAVASKIAERDASRIIENTADQKYDDQEEDDYADYKVPDDLMW